MLTLTQAKPFTSGSDRAVPPPAGLENSSDALSLMGAPMTFSRNEEIYGESEPADYLYKVVSGAVRTYRVLDDGRRQIIAFHLPGDMFGMEFRRLKSISLRRLRSALHTSGLDIRRMTRDRSDGSTRVAVQKA